MHNAAPLLSSALPRSVTGRLWQVPTHAWRQGAALVGSAGLHPSVAHILAHRGYTTPEAAAHFLNPRLEHLPDPATLRSMPDALERLHTALSRNETIGIFGDYDVDGTCATALLTRYLRALGVNPVLYIPDRLTEGYGPTAPAMDKLAAKGVTLLLTVDTGTTAYEALERARELGMDVIVTDHHQPHAGQALPPAVAILNPHRLDDTSELQGLSGSGVAFYLCMALNRHLRQTGFFTAGKTEPRLGALLDLVALATVADVMQLTGPNRVLVARGLAQMGNWSNVGLAALAGVAGHNGPATSHTAGFVLGPRLNAAGRIDTAMAALDVLLADDATAALPLASRLNLLNDERRAVEKQVQAEALEQAMKLLDVQSPALVLHGPGWHPGVVGIVASRVKEATGRPVFVLGEDANGHLKGSARSVPSLNVGRAVQAASAHTLSGGGHAMAAGVTLLKENLATFIEALNTDLTAQLHALPEYGPDVPLAHLLAAPLTVDATLGLPALTPHLLAQLNQLQPFGMGNPQPVLALGRVSVAFAKPVGAAGEHLKLTLRDGAHVQDAIAFGAMRGPLGDFLSRAARDKLPPIAVAGTLSENTWNGATRLDVQVQDALPEALPI